MGYYSAAMRPHRCTSDVAFGGAKAAFAVYWQDDVAVVILTNLQGSMPERFINRVAAYYILGLSE